MKQSPSRGFSAVAATVFATLLLGVASVQAAELTPEEYTQQVEPICKTNVEANKRIFKGAKAEIKRGELKQASRHFFRAAEAFGKTIGELVAVPQPSGYESKLSKWFGLLREERAIIKRIGQALAAEKRAKAESYSVVLNRNTNKANNSVLSFDFDYCRLDSSRFG